MPPFPESRIYNINIRSIMLEKTVKTNKIKTAGMIALLVAVIITIAIFGFSCVGGMAPIGWSGGAVSGDMLFVGSLEGRLGSVNMTDQSILRADMLQLTQPSGVF